jgi:hypothetical protein
MKIQLSVYVDHGPDCFDLILDVPDGRQLRHILDEIKSEIHARFAAGHIEVDRQRRQGTVFEEGIIPEPLRIDVPGIFISMLTKAGIPAELVGLKWRLVL